MNKYIYTTLMVFFLLGCTSEISDEEKLEKFLKSYNTEYSLKTFNSIIVINEDDGCLSCINLFASEHEKQLLQDENLFIISATGSKIDISAFILDSLKNVLWDSKMEFSKLNILPKSGTIQLDENGKIIKKEISPFLKE